MREVRETTERKTMREREIERAKERKKEKRETYMRSQGHIHAIVIKKE